MPAGVCMLCCLSAMLMRKPGAAGNVLLASAGDAAHGFAAKVCDFGLARSMDVASCIDTRTYGDHPAEWHCCCSSQCGFPVACGGCSASPMGSRGDAHVGSAWLPAGSQFWRVLGARFLQCMRGSRLGGSREAEVMGARARAGTVTHMPPELLEAGIVSRACDVWSFGILLWCAPLLFIRVLCCFLL